MHARVAVPIPGYPFLDSLEGVFLRSSPNPKSRKFARQDPKNSPFWGCGGPRRVSMLCWQHRGASPNARRILTYGYSTPASRHERHQGTPAEDLDLGKLRDGGQP